MSCDVSRGYVRITVAERFNHGNQMLVLLIGIWRLVFALQFDTDRKIVTARAPAEAGLSSVPGAPAEWHKLNYFAVAANQQMRRYLEVANFREVRMCVPVQAVRKELLHVRPAKISRRQADAMNDDEFGLRASRPVILIRRRTLRPRPDQPGSWADGVV